MKRNKDEILSKTLSLRIGVARKARLVYQSSLSFRTVSPFQNMLVRTYLFTSPQYASINQINNVSDNENMAGLPASVPN